MVPYLREPPRGFCDVGCCCCFFLTGGFYVSGLLFLATGTPPRPLRPIKASTVSEPYPGYFRLLSFLPGFFRHSFTASATVLSGHFLPTGVFYLTLLPDIFGIPNILAQPAFIKVSLGAGSYFLESCRASY